MNISYFFLMGAILANAFGQFVYKSYSLTKNKKYYFVSIFLFLLTPIFSFLALKNISVDIVYIFTAMTIFIVMVLSKIFLKEKIDFKTYSGVFLISLGVIIYGL